MPGVRAPGWRLIASVTTVVVSVRSIVGGSETVKAPQPLLGLLEDLDRDDGVVRARVGLFGSSHEA